MTADHPSRSVAERGPSDPGRGRIRVAVVDDHPATADGLAALLAAEGDITVVGTARDVAGARELVVRAAPDVVLCDIELTDGSRGFELLGASGPADGHSPRVVFLSSYDYPAFHALALDRGAAGYLLKTAPVPEIVAAVRTVAAGGTAFMLRSLRAARVARRRPSDRELAVLELVAAGCSNAEVGKRLGIGTKTVESHLRRLFARYGVDNRTELAYLAQGEGWIRRATSEADRSR